MRAGAARYWSLTLAGLLLAGGALVALNWALYHLMRTGTCASGGPYEIARPCPDDTGLHVAAMVAAPFVGMLGLGLLAFRGRRDRRARIGFGTGLWALLLLSLAGTAAWAAFGPDATGDAGAELAALVLAVTFVPMAILPLVFSYFFRRAARRAEAEDPVGDYPARSRIIRSVEWPPTTWGPR